MKRFRGRKSNLEHRLALFAVVHPVPVVGQLHVLAGDHAAHRNGGMRLGQHFGVRRCATPHQQPEPQNPPQALAAPPPHRRAVSLWGWTRNPARVASNTAAPLECTANLRYRLFTWDWMVCTLKNFWRAMSAYE